MTMGTTLIRASQAANRHLRLCYLPSTPTTLFCRRLLFIRTGPDIEWSEAQKILLSVDLEASAKKVLKFLAVIDRNRTLYEGPALDRAIYRYKNFWLPLLAKQSELEVLGCPLVVPLDCEWIWHIHRLNPTRYKTDCEEHYGRILDNCNVESTIQRTNLNQMKEFWTTIFQSEPFELNLSSPLMESGVVSEASSHKSMDYDLVSAVKRQITFFYQVSRPFMSHDLFLKEAIARYKGFLHLIKRNKEMSMKHFCIPTYDIDLIWHAHQLHSAMYCRDTRAIYGEVLEHDDTDSDRSEAKKLSVEFMETTKMWEEVYGMRYWKAGTMYSGSAPSPLAVDTHPLKDTCISDIFANGSQNIIQLPKRMVMEVLLEVVGVEGIPQGHGEECFIYISQRCQTNLHYTTKKKLSISPGSGKKQVVNLQSEPTAELLVELISSSSTSKRGNSAKIIGSATISLNDVLRPEQELSVDRWFELFPPSETKETKLPISLRISLSFTPPISAPYVLHMAPSGGVVNKTSVLDEAGNPVIAIYMRCVDEKPREVIGALESRKESTLARKVKNGWSLMESQWDFRPQYKPEIMYELLGETKVVFVPGKKLDFETKHNCEKDEQDNFITAVEFSTKNPYGKALALIDIKAGVLEIKEEWFLLPGTISAYCILYEVYGREWEKELEESTPKEIEKAVDARSFALYDIFNDDAYSPESGVSTGGGDDGGGSCSGGSCGGSCGGGCGG